MNEPCKKRKHVTLSLETKCEILKRLKNGESALKLSKVYNVGKSTISDIKKNSNRIKHFISYTEQGSSKRKTLKVSDFPLIDSAVYSWFSKQRARYRPITSEQLKEKAKFFQEKIHPELNDTFKASNGWISNFKKRHGIQSLSAFHDEDAAVVGNSAFVFDGNFVNIVKKDEIKEKKTESILESSVTHAEAVDAFNKCITWAEENNVMNKEIIVLKKLKKEAQRRLSLLQEMK